MAELGEAWPSPESSRRRHLPFQPRLRHSILFRQERDRILLRTLHSAHSIGTMN
jgi:hypothetical protein